MSSVRKQGITVHSEAREVTATDFLMVFGQNVTNPRDILCYDTM